MKFYSVTTVLNKYYDFSSVHPDVLNHGADRGKRAHALFAEYAKGNHVVVPRGVDIAGFFTSFKLWYNQCVIKPLCIESEFTDLTFGFYGHPDLVALLTGHKICVIDYKTPAANQKLWQLQCAAYTRLVELNTPYKVDYAISLRVNRDGRPAIATCYKDQENALAIFLNALWPHRFIND